MRLLAFRLFLKCLAWMQTTALRNLAAVRASRGLDGVLGLLETVDGEDAVAILRAEGAKVGTGNRILRGLVIHNASNGLANLHMGDNCHIGRQVLFDVASPIRIGNRVTLSMRVMVITHTNVGDSRCGLAPKSAAVELGDDVYVGAGAALLPGVRIGSGSIVGAGAVVTRDVPPSTLIVGVPGRAQRTLEGEAKTGRPVTIDERQHEQ